MLSVEAAVEAWDAKCAFVAQLGDVIDGRNSDGRSHAALEAVMGRLRKCTRCRAFLDNDDPKWRALKDEEMKAPIINCVGNRTSRILNFAVVVASCLAAPRI